MALARNEARVSLCDIPDRPGVMSLIFTKMAERKIPIDMVVQDVAQGGLAEVSFTVPQDDLADTLTAAQQAIEELGAGRVQHGTNVSKISVVGLGMRTHTGVAAQMFRSLADAGINIGMITTSEIKISALVSRDRCEAAAIAVHAGFRFACRPPSGPVGRLQPSGRQAPRRTRPRAGSRRPVGVDGRHRGQRSLPRYGTGAGDAPQSAGHSRASRPMSSRPSPKGA